MPTNKDLATNPNQYDSPELSWVRHTKESSRNVFFGEYLKRYVPTWKGKDVLDVGSGNGWLLSEVKEAGAKSVLGIEPSKNNVEGSKKQYPDVEVIQTTLEDFQVGSRKFDEIISIMSVPHIKSLGNAFEKVSELLNEDGEFLLVAPDFNYFRSDRRNYKVEVEDLSPVEYVATITRSSGTLVDLVRKDELYIEAAKNAGLDLIEQVPMTPTEEYLKTNPDFDRDPNLPLTQLFRFKKIESLV